MGHQEFLQFCGDFILESFSIVSMWVCGVKHNVCPEANLLQATPCGPHLDLFLKSPAHAENVTETLISFFVLT